jgi:alanine racemase
MQAELTIDLEAVAANWRLLCGVHGGPVGAVVKADGYGLGAAAVASRLAAEGARHFFVACAAEGASLRAAAGDAAICLLSGYAEDEAALCLEHGLIPVLGNLEEIAAWRALGRVHGRALPAMLHVDTGMNRLGLGPAELDALLADGLGGIAWQCLMTHLVSSEEPDNAVNAEQLRRFALARPRLPAMPTSIANSSGIFLGRAYWSDIPRPGAALYGLNPTPGSPVNPMRTAVRLSAPVLQVRDVPAGETVGYNATWSARRVTRVATVAAGYADGYHRLASNRAAAAFDGGRLPLIGRVSMDLITLDATDHPRLARGDRVELVGPALPPDEVAGWAGTNGYEVLTSLGRRVNRRYAPL